MYEAAGAKSTGLKCSDRGKSLRVYPLPRYYYAFLSLTFRNQPGGNRLSLTC